MDEPIIDDSIAIRADHVSKVFKLPHEKNTSLKSVAVNFYKRKKTYEVQQVLNNVSFEINKGDFFGIVGRNGSGKSTLLKLISGIYSPSEGDIQTNGKLTPFIELGVGFNPDLTGRENIFLNGALLGYSRSEMLAMYDEIVEFAELERFMDQKLKNYSSGMQVRLAFSIAIKARNDILIFDEVLAVGDEAFQQKCINVFENYKAEKQTVVLVTHDMEMVKKFCNRAMLISDGKVVEIGNPRAVANKYSELNQEKIDQSIESANAQKPKARYLQAVIHDGFGKSASSFKLGDKAVIELSWEGLAATSIESIGVHIFKQSGEHLTGINSRTWKRPSDWKQAGRAALTFDLNIAPGKYSIMVEAFREPGKVVDALIEGPQFSVKAQTMTWSGLVELSHQWQER